MKLHYFEHDNFGDRPLNTWLWPQLLPGLLNGNVQSLLVGVGSLLNNQLPRKPKKAIFGAGIGYGTGLPVRDETWKIYFVRGPRTAQALELETSAIISDSAMLVSAIKLPPVEKRYATSYMPHWYSAENGAWRQVCEVAGIHFIDPMVGVEQVLEELRATRVLISEALHGTIVADALRVPWIPVQAYKHILTLKWLDWCESLDIAYRPRKLRPLYGAEAIHKRLGRMGLWNRLQGWEAGRQRLLLRPAQGMGGWVERTWAEENGRALQRLARDAAPVLSDEHRFDSAVSRMLEQVECLKADFSAGRFN